MTSDLRQKLKEEIMLAPWTDLRPHWADRGAIVFVDIDLDLVDVGEKIVGDDTRMIEQWLGTHQLAKPNQTQVEAWDQTPTKNFRFLIVQPYVLIQEQGH